MAFIRLASDAAVQLKVQAIHLSRDPLVRRFCIAYHRNCIYTGEPEGEGGIFRERFGARLPTCTPPLHSRFCWKSRESNHDPYFSGDVGWDHNRCGSINTGFRMALPGH